MSCQHYEVNSGFDGVVKGPLGRIHGECPSWASTSQSIKTPQPTKHEQKQIAIKSNHPEIQVYKLKFAETFLRDGEVEFNFRANSKTLKAGVQNGVF